MANNNLVARLDNENIAIIDEINDHAVGENSGIFDETTDTLYPFGGGSASGIPFCTIKIDNQLENTLAFGMLFPADYFNWLNDNNVLLAEEAPVEAFPVGETTLKCIPMVITDDNDESINVNTLVKVSPLATISELVNCTFSTVESRYQVVPTDTTQNSSFTITLKTSEQ